jgi:hypothetical protein
MEVELSTNEIYACIVRRRISIAEKKADNRWLASSVLAAGLVRLVPGVQ